MDPLEVKAWCEATKTEPDQSVVISLPGEEWSTETVEKLVVSLSPDHTPWVMDIKSDPNISYQYALIEWWDGMPETFKRKCVRTPDNRTYKLAHAITVKTESSPTGPPQGTPRVSPEKRERVTPPAAPVTTLSSELCAVLGEIVAKCKKDTTDYPMSGYRKLRTFSGKKPVPSAEEGFEEWLDGATQALEEWEVPEQQKKQRIAESLKGPALEAIRNLKLSKKDCNAQDYLDILQNVFGGTEKVTELTYQLEHCYQKEKEKLSEFIRRLDKILHQILLKKGIDPRKVDEARAQQVLRGAQPLDPIALMLRTRQDGSSLEYPDLIRIVREEEAMLEDKRRSQHTEPTTLPAVGVRSAMATERDSEVETLKSQMTQVLDLLTSLLSKNSGIKEPEENRNESRQSKSTPTSPLKREEIVCSNCGGVGHPGRVCPSPRKYRNRNSQPAENFRGPR